METNSNEPKQNGYEDMNEEMNFENAEIIEEASLLDEGTSEEVSFEQADTGDDLIIDAEYSESVYDEIPNSRIAHDAAHETQSVPNFILYEQSQEHPKTPKKARKQKREHKTAALALSCLLLGTVGGIGGSYLIDHISGRQRTTVVYQSVEQVDKDGNNITNLSIKDIVANTEQSVVEITTESAATDSFFQQMVTTGAGSGVIISKDGYIVTNNHVVEGANKITVRDKSGKEYAAELIGTDAKTDLAVIKVNANNLSAAILGTSSSLSVGDEAIAIGNPLGELGGTVTRGIISALDREINIDGQAMTLLQTDTAINKGNSGGGLFNGSGQLIGIVNAKSSGTSVEGLGFAIPIDTAKPVIESLITSGYVTGRPQLGVSMVNIEDEMSAFQSGVDEFGVYIAKINRDSAAEEAGLKIKDRVISVDGKEIISSDEIAKIIDSKKVGDSIKIVVERDHKEVSLSATLKEAVNEEQEAQINTRR